MVNLIFKLLAFCCCAFYPVIAYVPENNINNTLMSYLCDDELLRVMNRNLAQVMLNNDVFQAKLDLVRLKLEEKEKERNALILEEIQKLKSEISAQKKAESSSIPSNCAEAVRNSGGRSGIHRIQLDAVSKPFLVFCAADKNGGDAWTIVQRRQDGSIDFYRNWTDYRHGFGNMAGEFFIGLDHLHALTQSAVHELWVQLEDFENNTRRANYDAFAIGNEQHKYALNVLGAYTGDAGDALHYQQGQKFSTKDAHNGPHTSNCAVMYLGAWWYAACHACNLNGQYLRGVYPKEKYAKGVDWNSWRGHYYSLKYVHMAIRPVK